MNTTDNAIYVCPHCDEKMVWIDDETEEIGNTVITTKIYVCLNCGHQEEIID